MSDLLETLRRLGYEGDERYQAAEEIERLRARLAEFTKPPLIYQNCDKHRGMPWTFHCFTPTQPTVFPKVVCPICEPPK